MSERKIIVLMGLPASGKSSFARELIKTYPSFRRVNKDTVREMINFSEWTHKGEALVQNIRDAIIHEIITSGYDVVIDDTNLQQVHIDKFNDIAELYDAKIEFIYFDVPLEECIRRDNLRVGKVGEVAIRRLWDTRTIDVDKYRK
jgi:predicted kinase